MPCSVLFTGPSLLTINFYRKNFTLDHVEDSRLRMGDTIDVIDTFTVSAGNQVLHAISIGNP